MNFILPDHLGFQFDLFIPPALLVRLQGVARIPLHCKCFRACTRSTRGATAAPPPASMTEKGTRGMKKRSPYTLSFSREYFPILIKTITYCVQGGNFTVSVKLGFFLQLTFPKVLYLEWGRLGAWARRQPMWLIKKYFGPKIAMYFAWLEFYTQALVPPAVLGKGGLHKFLTCPPSSDSF